jgi:hypothetical protein
MFVKHWYRQLIRQWKNVNWLLTGDHFGVHAYLLLINNDKTIMSHIYIKQIGSITQTFVLLVFLQGLTSMTTNLNQQSPPLALMATLRCNTEIISLMLPLEPCLCPLHMINLLLLEPCLYPLHLINLSPFVINCKGIFPSRAAPPDRLSSYGASSCTSKTYKIRIQKSFIFGVEITPSLW